MIKIEAKSPQAKEANLIVQGLQSYFVTQLDKVAVAYGEGKICQSVSWGRDEGRHGGGVRYETRDGVFNRGSVNVSQVHYDDDETKRLSSATAISTIIHPASPHAPSMHMHISWTQMRDGSGYWRVMADLNPSLVSDSALDKETFDRMLQETTTLLYTEGTAQGEKYFYIPVLQRHRGVSHYYLEGYKSDDFEREKAFVSKVGEAVIETYIEIISAKLALNLPITEAQKEEQLAYHTLYLFQVLTLDRGTTSGLLVHNQNDIGIMGSIPSHINKTLLASWRDQMPSPQEYLLDEIFTALPDETPTPVNEETKKALADAIRTHYHRYTEALSLQAQSDALPPTVQNHQ